MATKKNTMTQVKKTRKNVIDTIKSFNDNLIDIADVLIDETTASTAKYQKIAAKAIKKSEPIVQKNVEMIIDSAELMYQQYSSGSKKLQKLLGITKQVKNARKTFDKTVDSIEKNVKSLRNNIEEAAEDVEKRTKKIVKKVQKTA